MHTQAIGKKMVTKAARKGKKRQIDKRNRYVEPSLNIDIGAFIDI